MRRIKLTDKQLRRIKYKNGKIKRKFIEFNVEKKKQAEESKKTIIQDAIKEIDGITVRGPRLIGMALY